MAKATVGFSVTIFIPSGDPDGLRLVGKSNWIGQGLVFPRALFGDARKREELDRTGVYVLSGPGALPRVYVGEGDGVLSRLDDHARKKDFWTHAVVFTSKDHDLNKAHVQYLEARLVALANEAKRCVLENGNIPQLPVLSEADQADAEAFLEDVLLCLPIVGVSYFEKAKVTSAEDRDFFLKARGGAIAARGVDTPEGFAVRAGSTAAKTPVPSIATYLSDLRKALLDRGVLIDAGEVFRLAQDYTFNSPSTAAGVMLGRTANGRIEWKDAKGRTLKEVQQQETTET